MLPSSAARLSLRVPRPGFFRAFASRTTPPAGRGRLPRQTPSASRRSVPPRRSSAARPPPGDSAAPQDSSKSISKEVANDASAPSPNDGVSAALAQMPSSQNSLLAPVHIPEDPRAVLKETHPVMRLLDNSAIVVQRQLEMMNVLIGFEQANRYIIMDPQGNHIGYLAEQDHGIGSSITRQMFKTHRSFTTHVFDREEKEVLRFHRPFSWISSQIRVYDAVGKGDGDYSHSVALHGTSAQSVVSQTSAMVSSLAPDQMRIIGSAEQEWAFMRRKYNLFLARDLESEAAAPGTPQIASGDIPLSNSKALQVVTGDQRQPAMMQFARVDEPMLSWDFSLMSEDGRKIGSVNRNFAGFARELFTDTGVYALRMDAAALNEGQQQITQGGEQDQQAYEHHPGMTLDQRAVMLATAVSVDFDYFSRHSGGVGGGMWPMWMPWFGGGGEAAAGGAAAGEAGAIGAAETGIAGEAAGAARGLGAGEGAITGAGAMAGYEAMRGARGGQQPADDMSPQADQYQPPADPGQPGQGDIWGQSGQDPWSGQNSGNEWGEKDIWGGGSGGGPGSSGGGGAGEGGGGGGFDWSDWL